MNYLAKIRYDGRAFHGFQVQPDARTVQGELCAALADVLGVPVKVTGCSRTDAGVHALAFTVLIEADGATVPPEKLPLALPRRLPSDLSLFEAKEAPAGFHPRYDVKEKTYLYRIENSRVPDPFEVGRSWFLPRKIGAEGLARMNTAAEHLLGKHDFSAFMAANSDNVEDTVRTVTRVSLDREGDLILFRISADGFLYNMVRIIVGTLTEVAFGRFSPEDISAMIRSCNRATAGMTAPAEGLYLESVEY